MKIRWVFLLLFASNFSSAREFQPAIADLKAAHANLLIDEAPNGWAQHGQSLLTVLPLAEKLVSINAMSRSIEWELELPCEWSEFSMMLGIEDDRAYLACNYSLVAVNLSTRQVLWSTEELFSPFYNLSLAWAKPTLQGSAHPLVFYHTNVSSQRTHLLFIDRASGAVNSQLVNCGGGDNQNWPNTAVQLEDGSAVLSCGTAIAHVTPSGIQKILPDFLPSDPTSAQMSYSGGKIHLAVSLRTLSNPVRFFDISADLSAWTSTEIEWQDGKFVRFDDNAIYVSGTNSVRAFDLRGQPIWTHETFGTHPIHWFTTGMTLTDNRVILLLSDDGDIGSGSDGVLALEKQSGDRAWRLRFNSLSYDDYNIFVGTSFFVFTHVQSENYTDMGLIIYDDAGVS